MQIINKNKTKKYQVSIFWSIAIFIVSLFFASHYVSAAITGVYISNVYNTTQASNFDKVTWGGTNTSDITIEVRAGNDSNTADSSWTAWETVVNSGDDPSATIDNHQYIQYRASFSTTYSTTVNDANTALTSFVINYSEANIPSPQSLVSSKYDTTSSENKIAGVSWKYVTNLPSGGSVKMYLKTASNESGLDTASWQPITGCTGSTTAGSTITCPAPSAFSDCSDTTPSNCNDEWFQYQVELGLGSGSVSPVVDDIKVNYQANLATPELNSVTITKGASYYSPGTFTSKIYDTIANNGFGNINFVETMPTGGGLTMKARSCVNFDCSDKSSWSGCDVSSGVDLSGACVTDGDQYIQYQAELTRGTDPAQTPSLDKVTIDFSQLPHYSTTASITIVANISDNVGGSGVDTSNPPTVKIYNSSGTQIGSSYTMFDDGAHNDDIPPADSPPGSNQPDGRFGSESFTISSPGVYTFKINANDVAGNPATEIVGKFAITP